MHLEGIEPTTTRLRKPVLYPLSYKCMCKARPLLYNIKNKFASLIVFGQDVDVNVLIFLPFIVKIIQYVDLQLIGGYLCTENYSFYV